MSAYIEYRVVPYVKDYNDLSTETLAEELFLNKMGLDNWQLASYTNGVMYFSRPVSEAAQTAKIPAPHHEVAAPSSQHYKQKRPFVK